MSNKFVFKNEFTSFEGVINTTTKEHHGDTAYELVISFREFMLGCGFHINTVNDYIPDPEEVQGD